MKTFLFFAITIPALGQVHGDFETQTDQKGDSLYASQIVTEQYRKVFFLQRFMPAQGRVPRYELGAGWEFKMEKLGPCNALAFKPYSGLAVEDKRYLLSSMVGFGECYGHKTLVIIDRKNGQTGSFQYNRAAVNVYKFVWFRWDGFYKSGWRTNQPGLEVEAPIGKGFRIFATAQYDFLSHRRIHHFGFRF